MNPWQEHAANTADYQDLLKGDDQSGGATLSFPTIGTELIVDCRFERIVDDFDLGAGQIPKQVVPECKFMASDIPDAKKPVMRKGLFCVLKPNPKWPDIELKLWHGGIEQGGVGYSFMLVDRNYMV